MKKRTLLLALLILAVSFLVSFYGVFHAVDRWAMDAVYQTPTGTNNDIRIIAIDEKTLTAYGPFSSWARERSAELISLLNGSEESTPAVIGFDIMFIGESDPETDALLADACEGSDNVVTAVNIVNDTVLETGKDDRLWENRLHISTVELPYEALLANSHIGFANTAPDSDSYIRRAILYRTYEEDHIPSFSSSVYQIYCDKMGISPVWPTLGSYQEFLFGYSGKPGSYETVSLVDVLNGTVDVRTFRNCIVLVGAYAPGMQDAYNTPVDRSTQMYGVEIHANLVEALMEGHTGKEVNGLATAVIISLLSALYYLLLKKAHIVPGAFVAVVLAGVWMLVGKFLYGRGLELSLLTLPLLLVLIYVIELVGGYIEERVRRGRVVNAFKKYVAPQVVDELIKQDKFEISLGGENRDIAVMFVDIRNFTTMSESLEPEQVVGILNEYLELTTDAIFRHGGTLDKFIGDATMAIFNAPFDLNNYEVQAIQAAREIMAGMDALNARLEKQFGKTVCFGIGIHCGPAVVGNVGCSFRMDYTAIGDTVNTASRLESIAEPGQILVSEDVYQRLQERILVKEVGQLRLKGKQKEFMVYELIGTK